MAEKDRNPEKPQKQVTKPVITPQMAKNALLFLQRTDIKGSESEAMTEVKGVLAAYANN